MEIILLILWGIAAAAAVFGFCILVQAAHGEERFFAIAIIVTPTLLAFSAEKIVEHLRELSWF